MDKNHDCITRVRKELKENNLDMGWVRFDLSTIKDISKKTGIEMTGQRIEYNYQQKKKDGTTVEKIGKSFVTHDYCPFCGKKYR
jgi:hypothetical protein